MKRQWVKEVTIPPSSIGEFNIPANVKVTLIGVNQDGATANFSLDLLAASGYQAYGSKTNYDKLHTDNHWFTFNSHLSARINNAHATLGCVAAIYGTEELT